MLEFLKDSVVGFSLLTFAALALGPVLWRASRVLARQGLLFALISCGFLVSMASKPGPTPPSPTTHTIAYEDVRGAENPNPTTFTSEDELTFAPLADVEGYTFAGWTPTGIAKGTSSNVTARATWTAVPEPPDPPPEPPEPETYTIAYEDARGAENPNPTTFMSEDELTFAPLADVEGYTFAGWTPAGIAKGTSSNVTAKATWTAVPDPPDPPPEPVDVYELVTGEPMTPMALDLEELFGEDAAKAKSVALKGLPSGLKYRDGEISGTPKKSGVLVATVTLTTTAGKKLTAALTFVVRKENENVVLASCDATMGKVSGQGVYAEGKKVTLKATANKGYVFVGWYQDGEVVSRLASHVLVMPDEDVVLEAAFVTVEEDRAAIAVRIDALEIDFDAEMTKAATNVLAGLYVDWSVEPSALSDATVKVSGLPSGLKFTAKDIVDRKTGEMIVQANTIYGTPTAATKAGKPSAVKIAVTTAGKTKQEFVLSLTVSELPSWAVGTFSGGSSVGQVSLTVAKAGKTSGKWLTDGKTWTLSASGYDSHVEESEEMHETLFASLQAKCGKETEEILVGVTPHGLTGYDGTGILFVADVFDWKSGELKSLGAKIAKAPVLSHEVDGEQPGTVTLTFGADGKVKVAGQFQDGETGKQLKASGSAVLCPAGEDDDGNRLFTVYAYLPAKGAFDGYSETLDLVWNGSAFELGEELESSGS